VDEKKKKPVPMDPHTAALDDMEREANARKEKAERAAAKKAERERLRALLWTPLMDEIFKEQGRKKKPTKRRKKKSATQHAGADREGGGEGAAKLEKPAAGVKLQPHQGAPAVFLRNHHGVIVAHKTGSGKTITAIHAVQSLFEELPGRTTALIVTPKSLITNFKENLAKYGVSEVDAKRYEYVTKDALSTKLAKGKLHCTGKIIVFDEAQSARNTDSALYRSLLDCSRGAARVVLLTATPAYNGVDDILSLLHLINPNTRASQEGLARLMKEAKGSGGGGAPKHPDTHGGLANLLKCAFSFAGGSKAFFPREVDHDVYLTMSPAFLDFYNEAEQAHVPEEVKRDIFLGKDPAKAQVFMSRLRRSTNADAPGATNPKLDWISGFLSQKWPKTIEPSARMPQATGPGKVLITTAWGAAGAARVAKRCAALHPPVPCIVFSGALSSQQRDVLVDYYNALPTDKMFVLVLTAAGGVGLDLKETRYVVTLDMMWAPAAREQAIARAVRYKSHKDPSAVVNVYNLLLVKPKGAAPDSSSKASSSPMPLSSDELFERRIRRKTGERDVLMSTIDAVSIEHKDIQCPPNAGGDFGATKPEGGASPSSTSPSSSSSSDKSATVPSSSSSPSPAHSSHPSSPRFLGRDRRLRVQSGHSTVSQS
jgi:hypothetical protein